MAKDKTSKSDQGEATTTLPKPAPRLKLKYREEVAKAIGEKFGIQNAMALPRMEKVVISVGLGKQLDGTKLNATAKEQVLTDLTVIAGQKPIVTRAKKSVSNFKVREGYEIGAMVTLRGAQMWEFLDRLINLAIPRIKDFRGMPDKSFDKGGNYSFGINEQAIFPEVNMAEAKFLHGMNFNVVIKNSNPEISRFLLAEMGVPFVKPDETRN